MATNTDNNLGLINISIPKIKDINGEKLIIFILYYYNPKYNLGSFLTLILGNSSLLPLHDRLP